MREILLKEIENPIVMETHAGFGKLYERLYSHVEQGVAFEKDENKCAVLAIQRPTWAVYNNDSKVMLEAGVGFHVPVNFFDLDPYGDPWPHIDAVLMNSDKIPDFFGMAVNDGLRRFVMLGGGWKSSVSSYLVRYGSQAAKKYPEICREIMIDKLAEAGFDLSRWAVHSSGHGGQMTNYVAVAERKKAPGSRGKEKIE